MDLKTPPSFHRLVRDNGYHPSRWRLLLKDDKALTSAPNSRPVALTCSGKLLARIVAGGLLNWCDSRGLLPAERSSFRRGRDALEQMVLLTQRAALALNDGLVTAVGVLDVAKANDSVLHAVFLYQ